MLQANETVYLNERKSKTGGVYYSGYVLVNRLEQLVNLAKQTGCEAIGVSDMKNITIKNGKNAGKAAKVQSWTPFKMKATVTPAA